MAQTVGVDGNYNTTVQIVGDGNSVTLAGARRLAITKHGEGSLRARVRREFDLLKPYARALEMVGREDEQRSLRDWLTSGDQLSIRVLTGEGGSGKTRLALDLCDNLPGEDWQAGFLDGDDLKTYCSDASMVDWAWTKPTLIVVDYAATFADTLHRWLGRLADHMKTDAPALRILLLERQADMQAGWWRTLFGGGKARDEIIRELLEPARPIPIQPLWAPDVREKIFSAALVRTSEQLGKEPPVVEGSDNFDQRLSDLTWGGHPLFLMMAAMLAAREGVVNVLALSRTDLAMDIARRELRRIGVAAKEQGLDDVQVETLVGYVTLCQGLNRDALIEAIVIVQKRLHRSGDAGPIFDLLRDQLPGPDGSVAAVIPDVVGEGAILLAFDRNTVGPALALDAFRHTGSRVAASIVRTAQDFVSESSASEKPITWLDHLISESFDNADQLIVIADNLPSASRILVQYKARALLQVSQILRQDVDNGDARALPPLAKTLSTLVTVLRELGMLEDSLSKAHASIKIYRQLANDYPEKFLPNLAWVLHDIVNTLNDLGRAEDALEAAEESIEIYNRIADKNKDKFLADKAGSLNNLSNTLSLLGRYEEVVDVAGKVVEIYRQLARKQSSAFLPELAGSLDNLAVSLGDLGSLEDGIAKSEEAVRIYRRLAFEQPDIFASDLARAMNNMACGLHKMRKNGKALEIAQEVVDIERVLSSERPEAYQPRLARSLNNLANILRDLNRLDEANSAAAEGIEVDRLLATERPELFLPNLADSLNNAANILNALGLRDKALLAIEEAVEIRRPLAEKRPDFFLPRLAMSLAVRANCLDSMERGVDALRSNIDAISTLKRSFLKYPPSYIQWMFPMCQQYIQRCHKLGKSPDEDLLKPIAEAMQAMEKE